MDQSEEEERVCGEVAEMGKTRSRATYSYAEDTEHHPVTCAFLKVGSRQVASSDFAFALIS